MANITVRWTLPSVGDYREASRMAITRCAVQVVSWIQRDTAKGIDVNGNPFVPYTKEYAARKRLSGRRVDVPDLSLTGTLVRGLHVLRVESGTRAVIGWEGQHTARNVLALAGYSAGRLRQIQTGSVRGASIQGPLSPEEFNFLKRAKSQRGQQLKAQGQNIVSVAYAILVPSLNRKRRFFASPRAERQAILKKIYIDTIKKGVKEAIRRPRTTTRL